MLGSRCLALLRWFSRLLDLCAGLLRLLPRLFLLLWIVDVVLEHAVGLHQLRNSLLCVLSRLLVPDRLRGVVGNPALVHDHDQLFEEATSFVLAQLLDILRVFGLDQGDDLVGEVSRHVFELACA